VGPHVGQRALERLHPVGAAHVQQDLGAAAAPVELEALVTQIPALVEHAGAQDQLAGAEQLFAVLPADPRHRHGEAQAPEDVVDFELEGDRLLLGRLEPTKVAAADPAQRRLVAVEKQPAQEAERVEDGGLARTVGASEQADAVWAPLEPAQDSEIFGA